MSANEYSAHFALWALLKAPLMISANLLTIDSHSLSVLSAVEVIAISQVRSSRVDRWVCSKSRMLSWDARIPWEWPETW
jgi:hypothetical protein